MCKIREVLRLRDLGLLQQEIARSCGISQPTVHRYLERAEAAGLSWPLPEDCDDRRLKELLFSTHARSSSPIAASETKPKPACETRRIPIDFAAIHHELQTHKHVTLQLLWEEYCKSHADGEGSPYSYTRLCELYHNWRRKLDVVLRQDHRAGEKMYVDWAGTTIPIYDRATGESKPAYLFVAVLGASSYTFVVAKLSQQLPHWIACHIQALEFFQGAPQLVVPDNPKTAVTRACRYDPDLNRTYLDFAQHYHLAVMPARPYKARDKAKGFFANTLVLRTKFSFESSFRELLGQVKEVALGAYMHQDVPFEKLVKELGPERSLSRNPIFQVLFSLQNVPRQAFELKDLQIRPLPMTEGTAKFDLSLFFFEAEDGLRGTLEYSTDLFDEGTIMRMVGHLQTLLEAIVAHPECRLHDLPLLSEPERHQLLLEFNATTTDYRRDVCVHQLFEQQASRAADSVAVVWGNEQLSYAQLNQRANQLSHYLVRQGIGPGSLIGICMERSLEMLIGVLATLKAGAAYVPLDPEYPQDRLAFMLQDANAAVLLSQERIAPRLPAGVTKIVYVDSAWPEISRQSPGNPVNRATPEDLSYVIYTSGSTGRPKGVCVPHRALTNLLFWQLENSDVPARSRTLQFTSLSFDVSFQEIFATWLSGGMLVLVSEALRRDPVALLTFLRQQEIARLFLPFVALQQLAEVAQGEPSLPGSLREVVTAGEQLRITPQIANLFRHIPGCSLFNHYGPTESHVVTSFKLSSNPDAWDALPPIGKPIANTQVYILDRFLKPVPIGVAGELCIGGVSLAHGYLNRPELTAERFVPDPFSAHPGARLYRTGDLCRYRADGNIEYLGRSDLQVKVRGFRIELEEIESVLAHHPSVQQAGRHA